MFKQIRRAVATLVNSDSQKTVDAEFERARRNWTALSNVLVDGQSQPLRWTGDSATCAHTSV